MPANRHGSLLMMGEYGVLVTGASGSGKTALVLSLLRHSAACGRFASLVSDDQVLLAVIGGRLIGRAPASIGGLAEAFGLGPAPLPHEHSAVIDLLVRLVPADAAPRYQPDGTAVMEGVSLPCLELAERNALGAVHAVAARLLLPPFA